MSLVCNGNSNLRGFDPVVFHSKTMFGIETNLAESGSLGRSILHLVVESFERLRN